MRHLSKKERSKLDFVIEIKKSDYNLVVCEVCDPMFL